MRFSSAHIKTHHDTHKYPLKNLEEAIHTKEYLESDVKRKKFFRDKLFEFVSWYWDPRAKYYVMNDHENP